MKLGPGVLIPYAGPPPQFRLPISWDCKVWECHRCGVVTGAGVMPFPHGADCPPGLLITERFSWDLRRQLVKGCLDLLGDELAGAFA